MSGFRLVVVVCCFISRVESQTTTPCTSYTACATCVHLRNAKCLWCFTNNTCTDYPVDSLLPPASVCKLSEARWGVCWVNFEALLITMGVVGGIILIAMLVCCRCCCYCKTLMCTISYNRGNRTSINNDRRPLVRDSPPPPAYSK